MSRALLASWIVAVITVPAVLAGCDGGSGVGPASPTPPSSATPTSSAPSSGTLSSGPPSTDTLPTDTPAVDCPVTEPATFQPPPGVEQDVLFGWASSHGNGQLWVGGLGEHGVITETPQADGWIGVKLAWWRIPEGQLRITGHRLDAPDRTLRAFVPDGYEPVGFQASGVYFPTEGCWQVEGRVGTTTLTFVTLVVGR
jgi:hypothetical protein